MARNMLFATTLFASMAMAIPAQADADWKTKEVVHVDLDLSTPKGQDRLMTRVKQAVKQVCGSPRAITLKERIDQNRCETDALARAVPAAEKRIAAYMQNRQVAALPDRAIVGN